MNEFECLIPILNVKNFAASMNYYIDQLGFKKKWDWGNPPSFGCVARGTVEIFLSEGGQGQPGMWMSIFMEGSTRSTNAPVRSSGNRRRTCPGASVK
jgi:hypothetical protein